VEILIGGQEDSVINVEEETHSPESAALFLVQGWMPHIGPITVKELAERLGMVPSQVHQALLQLEGQGQVLRGHFRPSSEEEWCDRSLLARIHRRTVTALRREIEPVAASDFMRFLFRWQHCAPGSQLHGEAGLREIIAQLAGYETSASAWESSLLRGRVANYKPEWLDNLCLRGEVAWGRLTPPDMKPNLRPVVEGESFRRITPTSMAPISFVRRDDIVWMLAMARPGKASGALSIRLSLSGVAQAIYECLDNRGACFFPDLTTRTRHLAAEVEQALWELVAAGLVTADGFDPLRALLDPRRRRAEGKDRARRPRHSAGRWALLEAHADDPEAATTSSIHPHEQWAKQLARRYGVIFRDLLKRESLPVTWRELLIQYRRMEWRGEMRGGRFVDGFTGEQFALPEAVEALRAVRRDPQAGAQDIRLSPADPLNLVGIILPGERIPSHTSQSIMFRDGVHVSDSIPVMSLA
jgi:ATP-dependent Lhr-like helicase